MASVSAASASGSTKTCSDYDYDATEESLTAEFRHRIGLLPEEEQDLSEAFKRRIGLVSDPSGAASGDDVTNREVSEVTLSYDVEREATLTRSKFDKFVKSSYQSKNGNVFSKSPLTQPLLAKKNELDRLISLAASIAIKRFCGDVSVPTKSTKELSRVPVMTAVFTMLETLAQRYCRRESSTSNGDAAEQTSGKDSSKRHSSLMRMLSGSKQTKTDSGGQSTAASESQAPDLDLLISNIALSELDLVQFIVGLGILRREIRDEIYCQLCAQVTKNPSTESCSRGWLLHALCAGCFSPTHQLLVHYFAFLNEAAAQYKDNATQIRRSLHRTNAKGNRYHPPNWIEYQSVKARRLVMLPVQLADERTETVESDSSMTAGEICRSVATSIGLRDHFGFAIYISVRDKVSSLGQGPDHVMDAISECEQLVRSEGGREEDAAWNLYFRKEIFTPWHDVEFDSIATDLIYRQIVKAVQTNEYRLRSEEEVVRFVARRWYVEHGEELVPGFLQQSMHELIPQSLLAGGKSRETWTQAVMAAFEKMGFASKKYTRTQVKWSIVESGKRKWPLHFSGLFEAHCISGPPLQKNDLVIAVSCRGIFLLEEPYKVIVGLYYYDIVDVKYTRNLKDRGPGLTIITVKGEQWTFVSPNSETIAKLLCTFLDGLRRRSRWAVAIQDFVLQDHTKSTPADDRSGGMFRLRHGDVVELMDEMQQEALKDDWMYGRCERTGACGAFPFDCIYIIPTCEKPPTDFMEMFTGMSRSHVNTLPRKRGAVVLSKQTIGRYAGHAAQSAV